jgi:hypothetical protein
VKNDRKLTSSLFITIFSEAEIIRGNQEFKGPVPEKYDEERILVYKLYTVWLKHLSELGLSISTDRTNKQTFATYIRDVAAPMKKNAKMSKK